MITIMISIMTSIDVRKVMLLLLPIVVVLAAKVMTQGVVVHRPQQPVPSLVVHVTANTK